MVQYVTRSELRSMATRNLAQGKAKVAKAENRSSTGMTFLSHSSSDDELMPAVVLILENHGATVYLDKLDNSLAAMEIKDIASSLRTKISSAKKFILFASQSVKGSKWVPWELGLADGYKGPRNVAIFPAPENMQETAWSEQEYLGIYDRVVWGQITGDTDPGWLVWDHSKNSAVHLRTWLAR